MSDNNIVLYTINETCKIFKISRVTLWKWKKEGILKHINVGKSIRYTKEDINKLIESKATQCQKS